MLKQYNAKNLFIRLEVKTDLSPAQERLINITFAMLSCVLQLREEVMHIAVYLLDNTVSKLSVIAQKLFVMDNTTDAAKENLLTDLTQFLYAQKEELEFPYDEEEEE